MEPTRPAALAATPAGPPRRGNQRDEPVPPPAGSPAGSTPGPRARASTSRPRSTRPPRPSSSCRRRRPPVQSCAACPQLTAHRRKTRQVPAVRRQQRVEQRHREIPLPTSGLASSARSAVRGPPAGPRRSRASRTRSRPGRGRASPADSGSTGVTGSARPGGVDHAPAPRSPPPAGTASCRRCARSLPGVAPSPVSSEAISAAAASA